MLKRRGNASCTAVADSD